MILHVRTLIISTHSLFTGTEAECTYVESSTADFHAWLEMKSGSAFESNLKNYPRSESEFSVAASQITYSC